MQTHDRLGRRGTFDQVPDLYDQVRPRYPAAIYDTLMAWMGTPPADGWRTLEIGSGTGIATADLLRRGCRVTGVELGAGLAELSRTNLAGFGNRFEVIVGTFEEAPVDPGTFDLVAAASAFHWLDPHEGLAICHRALRSGGSVAMWSIEQTAADLADDFFVESQSIYVDMGMATALDWQPRPRDFVFNEYAILQASRLFENVRDFRIDCNIPYTTAEYIALKQTHSNVIELEESRRAEFLERIATLIDTRFDGHIVRPGVAVMAYATSVSSR